MLVLRLERFLYVRGIRSSEQVEVEAAGMCAVVDRSFVLR